MDIISAYDSSVLLVAFIGVVFFTYYLYISQKKLLKLNKNLEFQSAELNSIIKSANCGIMHIDIAGTIKHVNPVFCSFLGVSRESMKSLDDYLHLLNEEQQKILKSHLDSRVDSKFEQSLYYDGKEVHLNIFLSFLDKTKQIVVIATSREDKIQLQKALNRTQVFFEHSDLGHIIIDNDMNIIDCNISFCEIMGYRREELIENNFDILFKTKLLFQTFMKNYIKNNSLSEISNIEYRLMKKDGSMIWVEIFGKKFKDGNKNKSIWSIRDISVRVNSRNTIRSLNAKLQKEFDRLEIILDVIPMPIFIKDKSFNYIGCNGAFLKFLNLDKNQIIGKTVFEIFSEKEAEDFHVKDLEMINLDYQQYQRTLENKKTIDIYKKSLYDEEDNFSGFVGLVIDITDEVKEKKYLSQRVIEELEKNAHEREKHQKEQLENVKFSTIGKMAAGITHEINTPLTYIKGNFEMLHDDIFKIEDSYLKERMLEDAKSIKSGLERVGKIIETMREVSQKHSENKEHVNIYETLVSSLIISHNKSKQIVSIMLNDMEFDINFDKTLLDCCNVFVQKQRLEQVWIIIINNALDELVKIENFKDRKLDIRVKCLKEDVKVSFEDNAGGIQDSILDKIFEPFESTKESSGIGIGLNIAKKIIEEQDGNIRAFNQNNGAVFEVILPLKDIENED